MTTAEAFSRYFRRVASCGHLFSQRIRAAVTTRLPMLWNRRSLRVPREALTTLLLRPLSGAGSLAALQELMTRMGPDSRAARVAAVVVGSSETIFYTMTVYLAAAGVKKLPRALGISLLSWLAGVAAACCICR